jgi:hypothetical protein
LSDMAQLLRAKKPQSFVAYSFIIYDYAYDTKADHWFVDRSQDLLVHYLLRVN